MTKIMQDFSFLSISDLRKATPALFTFLLMYCSAASKIPASNPV